MASVQPFRALRFDAARVGSLDRVISQPYDKVDDAKREEYYARHPNHVVRLDKRKDEPGGPDRKYDSAAADLAAWMKEGVLVEDAAPTLYVSHQVYSVGSGRRTRKGLCAMVRLESFGPGGKIHPHEETHTGPKADRLKLLRATGVHFGHIFLLYSDPSREIARILDQAGCGKPDLEAADDHGDTHRAWAVTDPGIHARLQALFEPLDMIIADGHHRYETALNFREECRAAGRKSAGANSFDHVLATLVNMDDEGLTCFATHRVIRDKPPIVAKEFLPRLAEDFDVREYPFTEPEEERRVRARLLQDLRTEGARSPAFALALPSGGHALIKVRDVKRTAARVNAPRSEDWRSLDNNILHTVILDPMLGITPEDTARERFVDYVRSADEAVERVLSGRAVAAFLVNPVTMEQVRRVVSHGERFPQKSTDFHPKMITGLLMARLHTP